MLSRLGDRAKGVGKGGQPWHRYLSAFYFFEALAGFRQLLFGGLLSFLDEGVKDGDDLTAAVAVEGAANARTALGPEFKQTVAHDF